MKHNKWHLKMLHTFIVILLLSFSGFCTDIRTTKSASETKLIEMISRAKPLIEDVTGRKFKKRVKHRIINRSELYDMLRKCSTEYLKNNKNTDSETVAMRMESEAVISSQNIVGLYSDRTIYVIPENTESAMKTYKLSRDDFEKYVFLVVVHELVHALDEQHFHFRRMKCDMKNMEEYRALDCLIEGNAVYVTESIAEKTGMPDSVRTFSKKLTSDLSASQRLSSQLYIKGYEFVEALVRKKGMEGIKAAFESPPVSTAQILNPEDYFRPLKSHDIDYVKLFERIADNIAPDDMQTQTMGVGAMDLTSSLVLNGITQDEAFDIAKECIKGARFQATRPVAKPVSISLEIFDFKEAISAERLDETNRRIHESVINQIKASLNRSLDIIKEETLDLEGFNNVVFRHAVLKKVRTVTESVEAAGLMGSCYVSLKYENMEGITLDDAMKVLNMIHSEYSNLN